MAQHVWWILRGDRNHPASRIQGWNIHDYFLSQGISSSIVYSPTFVTKEVSINAAPIKHLQKKLQPNDIVIIQKYTGVSTLRFIQKVKKKGALIVYLDCDVPIKKKIAIQADLIITPSNYLKNLYKAAGFANVKFIDDAAEQFESRPAKPTQLLTCLWFGVGSEKKWRSVTWFDQLITEMNQQSDITWQFETLSNHPKATCQWTLANYTERISTADAIVLPVVDQNDWAYAKSANRAVQAMALSKPVVATPIPAYKILIQDQQNGFLCASKAQWADALHQLTSDERRTEIGHNAYQTVAQNYSIHHIGAKWVTLLNNLQQKALKASFVI